MQSAANSEVESEAAGAEERLQALGLADELPPGTFEVSWQNKCTPLELAFLAYYR
jgi:hypothetical protein